MPSPDEIFNNWNGLIDNDFFQTISQTFALPSDDDYVYRAESFAMAMPQIKELVDSGTMKYKYQAHGQQIEVPPADITAYTSIFSPATDTNKALTSFSSNAKKGPEIQSRRIPPMPTLRMQREHTQFFQFHHFGCVVPTYDALHIIKWLAKQSNGRVIDMASGNGYWTYMLRSMELDVVAVDNMSSEYRTMWIADTVKADGVGYLKQNAGGKGRILLMVYMVTAGDLTRRIVQAYTGDVIVIVGTQNANRYTGFSNCTPEEWFERERPGWEMTTRIAMPSFAGKDEGMTVWRRR